MSSTNIEAIYPLNAVQDGILYHTVTAPDSSLYIQQYVAVLEGIVDIARFREAWEAVIGRHEALRSFVTWDERQQPLQVVRGEVEPEWRVEDWSRLEEDTQFQRYGDFLAQDRRRGFTLDAAPLFRLALFRLAEDRHRFVWTHHHIVLDGWSLGLVLDEVFQLYERPDADLADPAPLRDHVAWYRSQDWSRADEYWRTVVGPVEAATRLGVERETDSPWAARQVRRVRRLGPELSERIGAFGRQAGVTTGTVFRGAWALVLSNYSDAAEVTFGAAVAGRPPELPNAGRLVGMFINSVPVRVELDADRPVGHWLRTIQADQAAGSTFESTPLPRIRKWSALPAEEPLFDSLLVFENVPEAGSDSGSISIGDADYLQESNYPLSILVMPGVDYGIHLLYDPDRYTSERIDRLLEHLAVTIGGLVEDAERPLAAVRGLPLSELQELLVDRNRTEGSLPEAPPAICELVLSHAERTGDATAVVGAGAMLSYRELADRSRAIAAWLTSRAIGPGSLVTIRMARSPGMIAAMLGVLRAGAGYVPMDPDQPSDRADFVAADTGAALLITDSAEDAEGPVLVVDAAGRLAASDEAGRLADEFSDAPPAPDAVAYVMYTSGSTGRPKGVAVSHGSLVASTLARRPVYGTPPKAFLVVSPLFFDSSVAGVYWALAEGGTVVLPESTMEQDVLHLASLVREQAVSHTLMLPSLYGLMLEHADHSSLASLDVAIVAGEACPASLVALHHDSLPGTGLFNEYGPTEATVWCTVAELEPAADPVPIGRPIPNSRIFVLDGLGRPTPDGAIGELHVSGAGLANGYWRSPQLTAERFVELDLPFVGAVRTYRTGDLVRFLDDGRLELVGRRDHQVKIRGQRIELEEIESVLRSHPSVGDAAAATGAGPDGRPTEVVAFVEPPHVDPAELRAHAAARLPRVMVPGVVVPTRLPRGATGKIDRRALSELAADRVVPVSSPSGEPRTATEATLAGIWASVLGVDQVGVHDNFFDLGGDSILTIRIIAQAHAAGLSMTPRQLFDHPTVAELAELLGE